MSSNAEAPRPLGEESLTVIDERIASAASDLADRIENNGLRQFQTDYIREVRLPTALTTVFYKLCRIAYDNPPAPENVNHPFSMAAYRGYITGIAFADQLLDGTGRFVPFTHRFQPACRALEKNIAQCPMNLDDYMARYGSDFACRLAEEAETIVSLHQSLESRDSEDRDLFYGNTVGYVGAAAVSELVMYEIENVNPVDRKAREELYRDVDFIKDLGDKGYMDPIAKHSWLSTASFPWLS